MNLNLNSINCFLVKIKQKKYTKLILNKKIHLFKKTILLNNNNNLNYYFVKFIINLTFKKSNTFIHIMDCLGYEKYFYSIKNLSKKLKSFKFNNQLEKFYKILIGKFKFLKNNPIAIHLNNIQNYKWFIEKLTKKFIVIIVKFYNKYSHNGCRRKKKKNKKRNG